MLIVISLQYLTCLLLITWTKFNLILSAGAFLKHDQQMGIFGDTWRAPGSLFFVYVCNLSRLLSS